MELRRRVIAGLEEFLAAKERKERKKSIQSRLDGVFRLRQGCGGQAPCRIFEPPYVGSYKELVFGRAWGYWAAVLRR
jgi:hypothetical protein